MFCLKASICKMMNTFTENQPFIKSPAEIHDHIVYSLKRLVFIIDFKQSIDLAFFIWYLVVRSKGPMLLP